RGEHAGENAGEILGRGRAASVGRAGGRAHDVVGRVVVGQIADVGGLAGLVRAVAVDQLRRATGVLLVGHCSMTSVSGPVAWGPRECLRGYSAAASGIRPPRRNAR